MFLTWCLCHNVVGHFFLNIVIVDVALWCHFLLSKVLEIFVTDRLISMLDFY